MGQAGTGPVKLSTIRLRCRKDEAAGLWPGRDTLPTPGTAMPEVSWCQASSTRAQPFGISRSWGVNLALYCILRDPSTQ
jgi:hypothetical protein